MSISESKHVQGSLNIPKGAQMILKELKWA